MKKWKKIDTRLLFKSEFVSIFEDEVILPNEKKIAFNRIILRDFVSIIAILNEKIVMVEILRYPRNCASLEIPSGHIENGESPEEAALRELEEETGYHAKKLTRIGFFYPLSRSKQRAYLFFANELKKKTQKLESTEQINVKMIPLRNIKKRLLSGDITHAPTIIALQRFILQNKIPQQIIETKNNYNLSKKNNN